MIMEDVRVSCYSSAIVPLTELALLAPVCAVASVWRTSEPIGSIFYHGAPWLTETISVLF